MMSTLFTLAHPHELFGVEHHTSGRSKFGLLLVSRELPHFGGIRPLFLRFSVVHTLELIVILGYLE